MPLINTYADGYLAPLVTEARETQAAADVAQLGTFPAAWVTRLTILRAYIITCLEGMKAPDDVFASKLAAYRKEFDSALPQARAAQQAAEAAAGTAPTGGGGVFVIDLQRA